MISKFSWTTEGPIKGQTLVQECEVPMYKCKLFP